MVLIVKQHLKVHMNYKLVLNHIFIFLTLTKLILFIIKFLNIILLNMCSKSMILTTGWRFALKVKLPSSLCQVSRAAIMKYHGLGGTNRKVFFTHLVARSMGSRCQKNWSLPRPLSLVCRWASFPVSLHCFLYIYLCPNVLFL